MKILKLVLGVLCGLWFLRIVMAILLTLPAFIGTAIALIVSGFLCYAFLKSALDEGRGPRIGY